jgi:hypothetical protein
MRRSVSVSAASVVQFQLSTFCRRFDKALFRDAGFHGVPIFARSGTVREYGNHVYHAEIYDSIDFITADSGVCLFFDYRYSPIV